LNLTDIVKKNPDLIIQYTYLSMIFGW